VSCEGKHFLQNLRLQKLVNCIKLCTEDQVPTAAYQVSLKGLQYLKTIPNSFFEEVIVYRQCSPALPPIRLSFIYLLQQARGKAESQWQKIIIFQK
jgi:hypothetical protein